MYASTCSAGGLDENGQQDDAEEAGFERTLSSAQNAPNTCSGASSYVLLALVVSTQTQALWQQFRPLMWSSLEGP